MKVAVCYTKDNESGHAICNDFLSGVVANGDEAIPVYDVKDIEALESCDVSFQVCEYPDFMKPSHKGELRWRVQKKQKELGKRRIIADAGVIGHERKHSEKQFGASTYYSIGFDSVKGNANFYNQNSPDTRWKKLKIELKPWRTEGDHILVLGQNLKGIGTTNIRKTHSNPERWFAEEIQKIISSTNRNVIFRPHPLEKKRRYRDDKSGFGAEISTNLHLENDLKNCWCVFSGTSNAAIDAVINGIPVVCNDTLSMAYDVSSHVFSENLEMPNRTQWAHDLAYSQWSLLEMRLGVCWKHLREKV